MIKLWLIVVFALITMSISQSCGKSNSEADCMSKQGCGWNGKSCGNCEDLSKTDQCIPYSGCGVDTYNTTLLKCKDCTLLSKEECSYSFGCKIAVENCVSDICAQNSKKEDCLTNNCGFFADRCEDCSNFNVFNCKYHEGCTFFENKCQPCSLLNQVQCQNANACKFQEEKCLFDECIYHQHLGVCVEAGCGYAENDTCNACINKTAETCYQLEGCVVKEGVCSTCSGQDQEACKDIKGCAYNSYLKCHYDLCNYQDNAYECLERFCGFNTELNQCQTCESREEDDCLLHYGCYWQDHKCRSCHHLNQESCLKSKGCKLVEGRCLQDSCPLLYSDEDEGIYDECFNRSCGIEIQSEEVRCTYCFQYSKNECSLVLGCGWDSKMETCISCNKLNLETGSIKGCVYQIQEQKYRFDSCANYIYLNCLEKDCGWNTNGGFCGQCRGNQDCPSEFCVLQNDFCFSCIEFDKFECANQSKYCVDADSQCISLAKYCNKSCIEPVCSEPSFCVSNKDCNDNGQCIRSKCYCNNLFYGNDCSLQGEEYAAEKLIYDNLKPEEQTEETEEIEEKTLDNDQLLTMCNSRVKDVKHNNFIMKQLKDHINNVANLEQLTEYFSCVVNTLQGSQLDNVDQTLQNGAKKFISLVDLKCDKQYTIQFQRFVIKVIHVEEGDEVTLPQIQINDIIARTPKIKVKQPGQMKLVYAAIVDKPYLYKETSSMDLMLFVKAYDMNLIPTSTQITNLEMTPYETENKPVQESLNYFYYNKNWIQLNACLRELKRSSEGKNYFDYDQTDVTKNGLNKREDFTCVQITASGIVQKRNPELTRDEKILEKAFFYGYNLDDWSLVLQAIVCVWLMVF